MHAPAAVADGGLLLHTAVVALLLRCRGEAADRPAVYAAGLFVANRPEAGEVPCEHACEMQMRDGRDAMGQGRFVPSHMWSVEGVHEGV